MTVAVVKGEDTLVLKPLRLGFDLPSSMSPRPTRHLWIGSVTKQFTASAVLLLAEQGS